jgi:hypothetical protein
MPEANGSPGEGRSKFPFPDCGGDHLQTSRVGRTAAKAINPVTEWPLGPLER